MVGKKDQGFDEFDAYDPVSGDPEGDVSIHRWRQEDGTVAAAFVPSSWAKFAPDTVAYLAQLQRTAIKRQQLRDDLEDLAVTARKAGASWSAIGWCVGMTSEGARQRWKAVVRPELDGQEGLELDDVGP